MLQSTWLSYISINGIHALLAILMALMGYVVARYTRKRLRTFFRLRSADPTVNLFVINAAYGLVLMLIVIIVLTQLGVPTTSLITILGAGSIAIGLAIKDSLANIASGLLLISLKPFRINDFVETNGIIGTVDQINLFTTCIKTANNEMIYIPNAKIMNDNINNKAHEGLRRIEMSVGISYSANIAQTKALVQTVIASEARALRQPASVVLVNELANSAVVLGIYLWVKKEDYFETRASLLEQIKLTFDAQGITIPYPQLNVHMSN